MSRKPPKHSEKKWVEAKCQTAAQRFKNSWVVDRNQSVKAPIRPERHLIVSVGTKTEPGYFDELKRRINEKYRGDRIVVEVSVAF